MSTTSPHYERRLVPIFPAWWHVCFEMSMEILAVEMSNNIVHVEMSAVIGGKFCIFVGQTQVQRVSWVFSTAFGIWLNCSHANYDTSPVFAIFLNFF